jgi:hypothetical protein
MKLTQNISLFLLFLTVNIFSFPRIQDFFTRRPDIYIDKIGNEQPLSDLIQKKKYAKFTFFTKGFKASKGLIAKAQYIGVMTWLFTQQGSGESPLIFENPKNTQEELSFYGPMTKCAATATQFQSFLNILPQINEAYGNMWEYRPSAKAALLEHIENGNPLILTNKKDLAAVHAIKKSLTKQDPEATEKLFKHVAIYPRESVATNNYLYEWYHQNHESMNPQTKPIFSDICTPHINLSKDWKVKAYNSLYYSLIKKNNTIKP